MMYKNTYTPIPQLPYCCVPATLQWILYRRGYDILNQEYIGAGLGLQLPLKGKDFFSHPGIIYQQKEPKDGFGTQIEKKKYSINLFFQKNKIPLTLSHLYSFTNEKRLGRFLEQQLRLKNDIILRYNNAIYKNRGQKSYGHFSIIICFDNKKQEVEIGDPEPPFFKKLLLQEILLAISDKIDGKKRGLYVVQKTPI